jgi:nitrogen fixation protein NifU and related proteins
MAELRDLYQETVLDHYKKPRNFRRLAHCNRQADGQNPLCGDKLSVFVQIKNGVVQDISFIGAGCAISTASASMMTERLKGKTESQVKAIYDRFQQLVTGIAQPPLDPETLGELTVFSGVREYPVRAKCAMLAWHTLRAALEGTKETVATE